MNYLAFIAIPEYWSIHKAVGPIVLLSDIPQFPNYSLGLEYSPASISRVSTSLKLIAQGYIRGNKYMNMV